MRENNFLSDFFSGGDDDESSIEELEALVRLGDVRSMVELATTYLYDWGRDEHDTDRALDLLRQAADKGYSEAFFELADLYAHGVLDGEEDFEKSFEYHRAFVSSYDPNEGGHTEKDMDMFSRVERFLKRNLSELSEKNARMLFEIASESESEGAYEMLGVLHQYGVGTEVSFEKAIECYGKMRDPHGRLAWLFLELGEGELMQKHLSADTLNPICIAIKGLSLLERGYVEKAYDTMCESSRRGCAHGHFALGTYFEKIGERETALEHYEYARENGFFGLDDVIKKLEG